jgi:hypothetical protein
MNSDAATQDTRERDRVRYRAPRLSVVVVSRGQERELERAVNTIGETARAYEAELIVLRSETSESPRDRVQRLIPHSHCTWAFVESTCCRDSMTERGMSLATGDVVAIRDDHAIRDAEWLARLAHSLGLQAVDRPSPAREQVV